MKREVVPTSPQYQVTDTQSLFRRPTWLSLSILVLGILGGSVASVVTTTYLLSAYGIQSQEIVIESGGTGSSINEAVTALSPNIRERTVSIVNQAGELVAQGVVVTTDGWIVTPYALQTGDQVLNHKRQTLEIARIEQDPYTGLFFLDSTQAGLPVVTWATDEEVSLGQRAMVLQLSPMQSDWVAERTLSSLHTQAQTEQSLIQLTDFLQMDTQVSVVVGVPVVALNSHLIGVLSSNQDIISGPLIDQRLSFFIEQGEFQHLPAVSLRSLFYEPSEGQSGFLVTSSNTSELQAGDIVVSLDGHTLSKSDQVTWLMMDMGKDGEVKIDLLRNGQPLTVDLTLE